MAEPSAEQVAAFKAAWEAQDVRGDLSPDTRKRGDRTRAGLRAVLGDGVLLTRDEARALAQVVQDSVEERVFLHDEADTVVDLWPLERRLRGEVP